MNVMSVEQIILVASYEGARSMMERIEGVFREEERADAFEVLLERTRAAIEMAFVLKARETLRTPPSRN